MSDVDFAPSPTVSFFFFRAGDGIRALIVTGVQTCALPISLAAFRAKTFGFVFQSYRLLPTLTAEENVRVPLELAGRSGSEDLAREWLERVGLGLRRTH